MLHELAIPVHIKGYHYLREAISLSYNDSKSLQPVTKVFYPTVAKKFNSSASKVERAIRHAISISYSRCSNVLFDENVIDKPTNRCFIVTAVEHLKYL